MNGNLCRQAKGSERWAAGAGSAQRLLEAHQPQPARVRELRKRATAEYRAPIDSGCRRHTQALAAGDAPFARGPEGCEHVNALRSRVEARVVV